jgi:superfamily II DNA/RNA helicase
MFIYEEYMARSSTRQSLKKGGNFMGMMNVLMQLRKVCNHPDLFEARSVVTPFVLEPIDIPISSCVPFVSADTSVFDCVSTFLCKPLWCGSRGEPSLDASMRHDAIESLELRQLEASLSVESNDGSDALESDNEYGPALKELLKDLREKAQVEKGDTSRFLNKLNSWRCQSAPSAYSSRLVNAVTVPESPLTRNDHDVISTPLHLLSMRRTQRQRADDADDLVRKFVFCVPKAGARRRPVLQTTSPLKGGIPEGTLEDMLLEPLEDILRPFRKANARLSSFFPDKKLVQFDAGKLQTLAELLRKLKKGGHRVLIFTQMSKMLDILETFLNLNGHVYCRLDGSTGVERRQRLMDRFNNDPKLFCFILSTRSGGLGINLTGADTVIFYDSDWNPAMDAQAQDRAHRIGQTRDVHIYRLVTEHTVEENILMKAQQKKNLDILVMDKGKFDASQPSRKNDKTSSSQDEMKDVYTKGGLRSILGVASEVEDVSNDGEKNEPGNDKDMSGAQMENAMATLEDADDVQALRGAQKEAADELLEFDETIEYNKDADPDAETDPQQPAPPIEKEKDEEADAIENQKKEEEELEKEFATWQSKVGMDASAIEASLSPTEQYGLRFREEIDPFYSVFAVMEHRRRMEAQEEKEDEIDIDEIERMKARLERQAIDDGELLATRPVPEDLIRQRNLYQREKSRLKANKKRRQLTGENWEAKVDGASQLPFWYNSDTGEALWDKPRILLELEELDLASEKGWIATPMKALVHIMDYLVPFPDRMRSSEVCRHWSSAANAVSFVRHVYPVEMGAYTTEDRKMEPNHYRTISEAISFSLPGDTIELGDGHYWLNEDLSVDIPLRLIGDESNPSNVIIEMSGTLKWRAKGGWFEGVTFRRPKISSGEPTTSELLLIEKEGRLDVVHSVFNNESCRGSVITVTESGSKGRWENVIVKSGGNGDLAE